VRSGPLRFQRPGLASPKNANLIWLAFTPIKDPIPPKSSSLGIWKKARALDCVWGIDDDDDDDDDEGVRVHSRSRYDDYGGKEPGECNGIRNFVFCTFVQGVIPIYCMRQGMASIVTNSDGTIRLRSASPQLSPLKLSHLPTVKSQTSSVSIKTLSYLSTNHSRTP
jgi:hypothetical protein